MTISPDTIRGTMTSSTDVALSIRLTNFFLSAAGFAIPSSRNEQIVMNVVTVYSTIALTLGCCINSMDLYHSWGTFHDFAYSFIAFSVSVVVLVKFFTFMFKKKKFLRLMKYTKKILWTKHHDEYEKYVIEECEQQAMYFMIGFICFVLCVAILYMTQPLILNIGRNETDRLLPIPLWVDLPIHITPWYEMAFLFTVLYIFHTGICSLCFDNFLVLTNTLISGQFKILKNRLEVLFDTHTPTIEFYNEGDIIQRLYLSRRSMIKEANHEFKRCVKQHQILIDLAGNVKDLYSFINLVQIVVASLLICFIGYQLILPGNSMMRRVMFLIFLGEYLFHLFMFTLTCNNLTIASEGIGEGPWTSKWYTATWCDEGKSLVRDLKMIIIRSRRPCRLTALGFFPVTLDTYKCILSAAFSYLMFMRSTRA